LPNRGWQNPYVDFNPNFFRLLMSTNGRLALIRFMADKDWTMGHALNWLYEQKLADLGYMERRLTPEEKRKRDAEQVRFRDIQLAIKNWSTMKPKSRSYFLARYPELAKQLTEYSIDGPATSGPPEKNQSADILPLRQPASNEDSGPEAIRPCRAMQAKQRPRK
jgi:hypothetical protein